MYIVVRNACGDIPVRMCNDHMNKLCRVACLVFRGECVRRAIGSTVLLFFYLLLNGDLF